MWSLLFCCLLQSKQGAAIRRNDENSQHSRSQGEMSHVVMEMLGLGCVLPNRSEEILHRVSNQSGESV